MGLLSLLSKELAPRSSCEDDVRWVGDGFSEVAFGGNLWLPSWISARGTGLLMLASLAADVSMVMVGARGLEGPLCACSFAMATGWAAQGCSSARRCARR